MALAGPAKPALEGASRAALASDSLPWEPGGGLVGWHPGRLAGCEIAFDASRCSRVSSMVNLVDGSTWAAGTAATYAASNATLGGPAYVFASASSQYYYAPNATIGGLSGGDYSFVAIASAGGAATDRIFCTAASTGYDGWWLGTDAASQATFGMWQTAAPSTFYLNDATGAWSAAKTCYGEFTNATGTGNLYTAGTLRETGTQAGLINASTDDHIALFGAQDYSAPIRHFNGPIGAFWFFRRKLSTAERSLVTAYLGQRWTNASTV